MSFNTYLSPVAFSVDTLIEHLQHRLADASTVLTEARAALLDGNTDRAVGTLVPLRVDVTEAKVLLDAVLVLYGCRR